MIRILQSARLFQLKDDGEQIIQVTEKGSIVLQARVFSEIVRKLPTNEVTIEVERWFANTYSFR